MMGFICIQRSIRVFRAMVIAFLLLASAGVANAYPIGVSLWQWEVTHNRLLAFGTLQPAEMARAALEKKLALQRGFTATTTKFEVGTATYNALMTYAKLLRTIRTIRKLKEAGASLIDVNVLAWAVLPQLKMSAPVEILDKDGNTVIQEKEIGVLGFVPHEAVAHWNLGDFKPGGSMFMGDDPLLDRQGGAFVNIVYPKSLSDLDTYAFGQVRSPFMENDDGDYIMAETDEIQRSIQQFMAHAQESILSTASRMAGYGINLKPQVVTRADGSRAVAYPGRLSPEQVQIQAEGLKSRADELLNRLVLAFENNGMAASDAEYRVARHREYFSMLADKMFRGQADKLTFAMNAQTEFVRTLAELENKSYRVKMAQQDEALTHLGQKKDPATGKWVDPDTPDGSFDIMAMVDRAMNFSPYGDMAKLQAKGLSARYSHDAFLEMRGLRNLVAAREKYKIAMEGLNEQQRMKDDIARVGQNINTTQSDLIDSWGTKLKVPNGPNGQPLLTQEMINALPK